MNAAIRTTRVGAEIHTDRVVVRHRAKKSICTHRRWPWNSYGAAVRSIGRPGHTAIMTGQAEPGIGSVDQVHAGSELNIATGARSAITIIPGDSRDGGIVPQRRQGLTRLGAMRSVAEDTNFCITGSCGKTGSNHVVFGTDNRNNRHCRGGDQGDKNSQTKKFFHLFLLQLIAVLTENQVAFSSHLVT